MKEYKVFQIRCEKGITIHNLFSVIDKEIVYHDIFFELSGMHTGRAAKQPFNTSSEFRHSFQAKDFNNNKWEVFSNLNENWTWGNPQNTRSLTPCELQDLIRFADHAGSSQYGRIMLGLDRIEWEKGNVETGTYGYTKAESLFAAGYNYLSNSIIIYKDNISKSISCYIACESKYSKAPSLQKMLNALGKPVYEDVFFAPNNTKEREEWEHKYRKAESDFSELCSSLPRFYQSLPAYPRRHSSPKNTVSLVEEERDASSLNTKKISSSILQAEGWQKAKTKYSSICYQKQAGDGTLVAIIDSKHKGHMLYTLLDYHSEFFSFEENINFFSEPLTTSESEEYFYNLSLVLDYIVSFLNNKKTTRGTGDGSLSHNENSN